MSDSIIIIWIGYRTTTGRWKPRRIAEQSIRPDGTVQPSVAFARRSSIEGFRQKIPFQHQLVDLGVEPLNLRSGRFGFLRGSVRERRGHPLNGLLLPRRDHRRTDAVLRSQVRNRWPPLIAARATFALKSAP